MSHGIYRRRNLVAHSYTGLVVSTLMGQYVASPQCDWARCTLQDKPARTPSAAAIRCISSSRSGREITLHRMIAEAEEHVRSISHLITVYHIFCKQVDLMAVCELFMHCLRMNVWLYGPRSRVTWDAYGFVLLQEFLKHDVQRGSIPGWWEGNRRRGDQTFTWIPGLQSGILNF